MFSTINNSWKGVENIVEKWGFSPNVPKSKRGIIMGYFNTNKTYVVGFYSKKIMESWDMLFDETFVMNPTWNGDGQIIK
jgi:hypothetical protein